MRRSTEELESIALEAYRAADERGEATGAFNLGVTHDRRGELEEAEAAYARADERGHALAAHNLGILLQQRGDVQGAEAAFRRAQERGHRAATDRLYELLVSLGDQDGANHVRVEAAQRESAEDAFEDAKLLQRVLRTWAVVSVVLVLIELVLVIKGDVSVLDLVGLLVALALVGAALFPASRPSLLAAPIPVGVLSGLVLWVWNFELAFAIVFAVVVAAALWYLRRHFAPEP